MIVKETNSGFMYEIKLPQNASGNVKIVCPVCSSSHSRGKEHNKDLSFNIDSKTGKCHRCDAVFYVPIKRKRDDKKVYAKPEWKNTTDIDDNVIKYFEGRKISQATIRWNNIVSSGKEYIAGSQAMTIQFNYWRNGELVNIKYRDAKKNFKMFKDAELIFYNIDSAKGASDIIITEGEFDCLSLLEAGYKSVLSVPNGAKSIDFIENCIDDIAEAKKIILAVDQDAPGYSMREELARRLGIERCYKVDFGDCKDANEYLIKYGAEKLREVIDSCEAFPIEGVFTSADLRDELDQLYFKGLPGGELIDIPEFDKLLAWQAGRVYTVTGIPGHGKSEFIDFVLTRLNILRGWKPGYFSPENWPIELHISKIVEKITGKRCNATDMPRNVFEEAVAYMEKNFYFILPEEDFTVDSILSRASGLVERKGINVLVIDPYNRLEHKIPTGVSETHYISSFFDKIGNFAKRKNVMVILVAHPTKMKKENGKYEVPNLYDISGSANFYNKTDFGLTVYRDMTEEVIKVYIQKVKFKHLGEIGYCTWKYNINNGRFAIYDGYNVDWDNISYFKRNGKVVEQELKNFYEPIHEEPPF